MVLILITIWKPYDLVVVCECTYVVSNKTAVAEGPCDTVYFCFRMQVCTNIIFCMIGT